MRFSTAYLFDVDGPDHLCHFGIISAPLAAFLAADVGLGAFGGAIGAGALEGAALGAGSSAIFGGDPLKGALTGGLTGGAIGGAGAAGFGGLGQTAVGAGAGVIGAELTGQNPLTGALTGGAAGAVAGSGVLSGAGTSPPSTAAAAPGGASGAAATAPASVAAPTGGPDSDLTSAGAAAGTAGGTPVNSVFGTTESIDRLAASPEITGGTPLGTHTSTPPAPGVADSITGGGASGGSGTLGNIGSFIQKNPAVALGGAALAYQGFKGSQPGKYENQLAQVAGEAQTHANVLESFQLTGTLPSGLQTTVDRYRESAVAKIKGQYAALGMSNSTAETEAIANAHQTSAMNAAKLADDLAKQGLSWEQLSHADISNLLTAEHNRDQSFTTALTSFAAALGGGSLKTG